MKKQTAFVVLATVLVTLVLTLASCSAQQAQKKVDDAAQKVAEARVIQQLEPSVAHESALLIAMETYNASVREFQRAKESDDTRWGAITALVGIGSAALGVPLGGLLDPFRKLITGQAQGAAAATTAITNADTGNVFQEPVKRDAVLAGLTNAHPAVATAVANHL